MVKEFLSEKGIGFQERDVSRNPAYAQELMKNTGQMSVPVTIIDGQMIVGFDRTRLEQVIGQQQQPSLGATVADASKITAKEGTGITLGAYVGKVRPGSLANMIGLTAGDIITEVNMQPIANADGLEKAITKLSKGSRISLVFLRGNKRLTREGMM
jgi:glutaredoxin